MAISLPHPEIASLGKIGGCGMQQQTWNTYIELAWWLVHASCQITTFSEKNGSRCWGQESNFYSCLIFWTCHLPWRIAYRIQESSKTCPNLTFGYHVNGCAGCSLKVPKTYFWVKVLCTQKLVLDTQKLVLDTQKLLTLYRHKFNNLHLFLACFRQLL